MVPSRALSPTLRGLIAATSLAAGCFVDAGSEGPVTAASLSASSSSSGDSSGGEATTADASTSASTATSGDPTTTGTTTSAGSSSGATDPATSTSTGTTTGSTSRGVTTDPPASCGDGQLDPGELCDDGNMSPDDLCLPDCTPATCDDGIRNQGESDVDCGGPCGDCDLCQACATDSDCAVGSCEEGLCRVVFDVAVDWVAHCGDKRDSANWVKVAGIPAGTYTATAKMSAGSQFAPPYEPPQTGWGWYVLCDQIVFKQMATPYLVFYATADKAYAALSAKSEDFVFGGGTLACGITDVNCEDNQGATAFRAVSKCP